jgi:hypothetical protein
MQPYVVRQGDFLALIAHKYGFDPDQAWSHPANKELHDQGRSPSILYATDLLYIPEPSEPTTFDVKAGSTNVFTSHIPTVTIEIHFKDTSLASQAFTVPELPEITGTSTGGDGTASFEVPVNVRSFTVMFTASGTSFAFLLGHLDPVCTLSGVFQRLQNLGYIPREVDLDPMDLEGIRRALRQFKADHPDDMSDQTDGQREESDSDSPDSDATANDSDNLYDPSVLPPAFGGLDDDGNLERKTAKLLVKAHGQ